MEGLYIFLVLLVICWTYVLFRNPKPKKPKPPKLHKPLKIDGWWKLSGSPKLQILRQQFADDKIDLISFLNDVDVLFDQRIKEITDWDEVNPWTDPLETIGSDKFYCGRCRNSTICIDGYCSSCGWVSPYGRRIARGEANDAMKRKEFKGYGPKDGPKISLDRCALCDYPMHSTLDDSCPNCKADQYGQAYAKITKEVISAYGIPKAEVARVDSKTGSPYTQIIKANKEKLYNAQKTLEYTLALDEKYPPLLAQSKRERALAQETKKQYMDLMHDF